MIENVTLTVIRDDIRRIRRRSPPRIHSLASIKQRSLDRRPGSVFRMCFQLIPTGSAEITSFLDAEASDVMADYGLDQARHQPRQSFAILLLRYLEILWFFSLPAELAASTIAAELAFQHKQQQGETATQTHIQACCGCYQLAPLILFVNRRC